MKRTLTLLVLAAAALALAASGLADPGNGKGQEKAGKKHGKFRYTVLTTDNGSCGTQWANDALRRTFHVKRNQNGSYTLTRRDRGMFVTTGGTSPGACDTSGKHGSTVLPAVTGRVVGFLRGTVTGGTFNPNATCAAPAAECGFTDVFIATFFGPNAQFSCFMNSPDCKFNYNYTSRASGLKYRHWQNKGKGAGTLLKEEFKGDIANA